MMQSISEGVDRDVWVNPRIDSRKVVDLIFYLPKLNPATLFYFGGHIGWSLSENNWYREKSKSDPLSIPTHCPLYTNSAS
jgi:hypothetical protein